MLVSPNNRFVIFNNSSRYRETAASPAAAQLPNRILRLKFTNFSSYYQHQQAPLFYGSKEKYYFQGPLPGELDLDQLISTSPLSCFGMSLVLQGVLAWGHAILVHIMT